MTRRYGLFTMLFSILVMACSHDHVTPTLDYSDAIQLQIGDYWVYQDQVTFGKATTGTPEPGDSTYIRKDTTVRGERYFVLENQFGRYDLERNANGTLVDTANSTFFSGTNFTDTLLRDNSSSTVGLMQDEKDEVTVPAGKFKTVVFIVLQRNASDRIDDPNDPTFYTAKFSIETKTWYAKGVGVVKQIIYYGDTGYLRELKRYKIEK